MRAFSPQNRTPVPARTQATPQNNRSKQQKTARGAAERSKAALAALVVVISVLF
jgi:hypothetical protein